jgi:hypothetical protein
VQREKILPESDQWPNYRTKCFATNAFEWQSFLYIYFAFTFNFFLNIKINLSQYSPTSSAITSLKQIKNKVMQIREQL